MDEVSLAGQGTNFGATGQPVRGVKRQAESPLMNNAINTKRQRKGKQPTFWGQFDTGFKCLHFLICYIYYILEL